MPGTPVEQSRRAAAVAGTSIAGTAFTPSAGDLVVVTAIWTTTSGSTPATLSVTDTLGTLSWTQVGPAGVADSVGPNGPCAVTTAIFYAIAPGGHTGTVTVNSTLGAGAGVATIWTVGQVDQTTPVPGTGSVSDTSHSNTSATATLSRAPAATSYIFAVGSGDGISFATTPSGFTNLDVNASTPSQTACNTIDGLASGGSSSVTWTAIPQPEVFQGIVLEIAAVGPTPPRLTVINQAAQRAANW